MQIDHVRARLVATDNVSVVFKPGYLLQAINCRVAQWREDGFAILCQPHKQRPKAPINI